MPFVKRLVIHAQGGIGVKKCFDYITRDDKTDQKAFVSTLNCSKLFAPHEFKENARRFHKDKDDRVAYHIIQAFDPCDLLTPDQAHEIGVQLCQSLYPGYQCVIATHIDRAHLHNHILTNAVNMDGSKLKDKRFDKEGIMELHRKSDEISARYGCSLLQNPPYEGKSIKMHRIRYSPSQSSLLKKLIDKLKAVVNSLSELLKQLVSYGYEVRRNQKSYIAVKAPGSSQFRTLKTLGAEYTEAALNQFFAEKTARKVPGGFNVSNLPPARTPLQKLISERIRLEYSGIWKSSMQLNSKDWTPDYYNRRYKALEELTQLSGAFSMLSFYNIQNLTDIDTSLTNVDSRIKVLQQKYSVLKIQLERENSYKTDANTFISKYQEWNKWNAVRSKSALKPTQNVIEFFQAAKKLQTLDLQEVKKHLQTIRNHEKELYSLETQLQECQEEKTIMEGFKKLASSKELYIKKISFHEADIDPARSTKDTIYIHVPNTGYYLNIPESWLIKQPEKKEYTLFLVDDKKYHVFDRVGHEIDSISGAELYKQHMEPPVPEKSGKINFRTLSFDLSL